MNIISHLIPGNLIYALGWTLIHSIWQGAAAAFGFALVMFFMRRYRSKTRYLIGVMALMLILAMSMVTFVSMYHPGTQGNTQTDQSDRSKVMLTRTAAIENLANPGKQSFFIDYFNRHLPLMVTIWFLGVLVLVLRFAGGFLYNQRVKVHRTRPLSTSWQSRLENLCLQANIRSSVRLIESALVNVPMTIGHFKPVILLPIGLVTGLPQDQVEALLAHELAHISRKDYLVNILQNIVDILFFYHPGVRWISSHIRSEREHCCDDIAVSVSGDSVSFARALTNIQGYGPKNANPAMAATGRTTGSYGLLNRIKRLVSPRKNKISSEFTEGFIGAAILGICILGLVVSANATAALNPDMIKTNIPAVSQKSGSQDFTLKTDAYLEIKGTFKSERDVPIDCRLVNAKTNQTVWHLKEENIKKGNGFFSFKDTAFLKKGEYKWHASENCTDFSVSKTGKSAKTREKIVSHITSENEMETEDEETLEIEETETVEKEVTMEAEVEMEIALEREKEELKRHEKEIEKALQKQEKELKRRKEELKRHEKEKTFFNSLKRELLSDKLIDNEEDFEFKLTAKKLIINGAEQSRAVFEKYKKFVESHKGKEIKGSDKFHIIDRK